MAKKPSVVHSDPDILGGTPVFVGTRVPLRNLFDYLERGHDIDEFLDAFPSVSREQAIAILKNCRDVVPLSGKLLVIDFVIAPGNQPGLGKMADVEMLVMAPGGKERTEEEFRELFEKAGFELSGITPTARFQSVIEGIPL